MILDKKQVVDCKIAFLPRMAGCVGQRTLLVLTRWFLIDWLKIPFLGKAKTVMKVVWLHGA